MMKKLITYLLVIIVGFIICCGCKDPEIGDVGSPRLGYELCEIGHLYEFDNGNESGSMELKEVVMADDIEHDGEVFKNSDRGFLIVKMELSLDCWGLIDCGLNSDIFSNRFGEDTDGNRVNTGNRLNLDLTERFSCDLRIGKGLDEWGEVHGTAYLCYNLETDTTFLFMQKLNDETGDADLHSYDIELSLGGRFTKTEIREEQGVSFRCYVSPRFVCSYRDVMRLETYCI